MLDKVFDRDRLVMVGLVLLGVLTVAAGFLSGRSTFQYALSTDARQASTQWVKEIEASLFKEDFDQAGVVGSHLVTVSDPDQFRAVRDVARRGYASDTAIATAFSKESGLLGGVDMLVSGWIGQLTRFLDNENHVSHIRNFAVLSSGGAVVAQTSGLEPGMLQNLLSDSVFQAEIHKSIGLQSTRFVDRSARTRGPAGEFSKTLVMPIINGGAVTRLYLFEIDQSSAATMSKVALVAASLMTSLLIVLAYSVPAAIAFRRIRERWKAEDKIRFLALHDPLTGLSNRIQLQSRLEQAISRATRHGHYVGVMCIDLDRFKEVNDTLGHKAGDHLLVEVANRLRMCVRETDVIARLGGDEFVIVAEELETPAGALPVARRICNKLAETVEIDSHKIAISCSLGITFAPSEGTDIETLLNNADLALYRAKNDGRNTFRFFEPEMDDEIQTRRSLAADLRHALRSNALHLQYQPHFSLKDGQLTGYEALARWTHPERGEIPPSRFVPIAEENGLIGILGEWVLHNACEYARHWPKHATLSVNISPAQFAAQDLVAVVKSALTTSGLPPERLLLEFTEELLFRNTAQTVKTLKEITAMGVNLAIDNFGSGYSSLAHLTSLPVKKIKIDQAYVRDMVNDKDASAVVRTIIGIGQSLDLTIVAEGVETEDEACHLRDFGCAEVQGFLFGRPSSQADGNAEIFDPASQEPGRIEPRPPCEQPVEPHPDQRVRPQNGHYTGVARDHERRRQEDHLPTH